jgi:hypothetical protein
MKPQGKTLPLQSRDTTMIPFPSPFGYQPGHHLCPIYLHLSMDHKALNLQAREPPDIISLVGFLKACATATPHFGCHGNRGVSL